MRFKTFFFWELYRGYVVAIGLFVLVQSGLISFLLRQRAQRRRAQEQQNAKRLPKHHESIGKTEDLFEAQP